MSLSLKRECKYRENKELYKLPFEYLLMGIDRIKPVMHFSSQNIYGFAISYWLPAVDC